jgi:hypothetical protein
MEASNGGASAPKRVAPREYLILRYVPSEVDPDSGLQTVEGNSIFEAVAKVSAQSARAALAKHVEQTEQSGEFLVVGARNATKLSAGTKTETKIVIG